MYFGVFEYGGGEGIRTLVGARAPQPISSRCRYDRFEYPSKSFKEKILFYRLDSRLRGNDIRKKSFFIFLDPGYLVALLTSALFPE